jgi:hypothetical protein
LSCPSTVAVEVKGNRGGGEAYTQQGRAHSRRLHPDWAARRALMSRAAHAVESKAVVRTEVAVSPRPCLGCAVELVLRARRCLPVYADPGSTAGQRHYPELGTRSPLVPAGSP